MWIELSPDRNEVIDVGLNNWEIEAFSLAREWVNDNRDKNVQEDLRDDDLEAHVVRERNTRGAAHEGIVNGASILHPSVVVLFSSALEHDTSSASWVEHDRVPSFASCASEQGEEGSAKGLEVRVPVHCILSLVVAVNVMDPAINLDETELLDANDSIHEDEQE